MSRSSAKLFRFGSAALSLLLFTSHSIAADEDDAWLEKSREILNRAQKEGVPEWLRTEPSREATQRANEVAAQSVPQELRELKAADAPAPGKTLIFGSMSLPRQTLLALLEEATTPGVLFVLRGVPKGMSIPDAQRQLATIAKRDLKKTPNIIIDPALFKRHAVTVVPTMVTFIRPPHEVRIEGDVTLSLFTRLAATAATNENVVLPRRGAVHEIGEPDLIVEMQQRLAAIDWAKEKARAIDRFWQKKKDFVLLPDARENREFLIDPSVRITEDLHDANGAVLVRAGDTINPLSWTTLSKTVIAFDGTDRRHIDRVIEVMQRARQSGRGVILLTSTVDTTRAWEHLSELERELKGTVYLLPRTLTERFQLQHLPSTVVAKGNRLLVTELAVSEAST